MTRAKPPKWNAAENALEIRDELPQSPTSYMGIGLSMHMHCDTLARMAIRENKHMRVQVMPAVMCPRA